MPTPRSVFRYRPPFAYNFIVSTRVDSAARRSEKEVPMSHGPGQAAEVSLEPSEGWHCSHLYYRFDRAALAQFGAERGRAGREAVVAALEPQSSEAPARLQTSLVSGHKADFGLMLLDGNPLAIDAVHQRLMAGPLGPAIVPTYSFVSV